MLVFEPAFFADSQPNTALDMIARLPGFGLDNGDSGTRGFAGAAGNVLIDGARPSSKSDSLEEVLRRIAAAGVERIELIRGGASGIDMQGQAVVANVVIKRTVQTERVIELNTYLYNDGYLGPLVRAAYSRREGENQIEGAITATTDRTHLTADGYRRRFNANDVLIQAADLDLYDLVRNVDARGAIQRPFAGGRLRINALLRHEMFVREITTGIIFGPGFDEFSSEDLSANSAELGMNWTRAFSDRTEVELTALQRSAWEDYFSTGANGASTSRFGNDATSGESIGRAVLRFRRDDRWAFEGGGEVAYNFLDSASSYAENGVSIPLPSAEVKVEELRGEAFGQTTWRPNETLTVEAALRVEVSEISQSGDSDQAKSFVYPKPRVQITWTPLPGHQWRFRAEREVGQLDFGDFVASAEIDLGQVDGGNPDLEPSKTTVFEMVYERRFWDQGVLTLTASRAQIEDVIDVIPLTGGFEAVGNIGEGRSTFFSAALTLPLDRLGLPNARLRSRIGVSDTEVTDPLTGETRRFSGNTAVTCANQFNQDLMGGRWSYGVDVFCPPDAKSYRIREVRRNRNDPYQSVFVQWKPRADMTIRLDIGKPLGQESLRVRDLFSGPRDTSPLLFHEERGYDGGPFYYLQFRKTL